LNLLATARRAGRELRRRMPEFAGSRQMDLLAEKLVLEVLQEAGEFFVLTEESGAVMLGNEPEHIAVVDPVDGSYNAMRGVPFYALSIGFADYSPEARLLDVHTGYVLNLHTGDEFEAEAGRGARLNRRRIACRRTELERSCIVAYCTGSSLPRLEKLLSSAKRVRTFGSAALELCHLAKGDFQAFVDLRGYLRNVDVAASLRIVQEAGGSVSVDSVGLSRIERLSVLACCSGMEEELRRLLQP